ncbi:MAG: DUF5615 family PIN-like protein [Thermoanaerobaculia bacterium]
MILWVDAQLSPELAPWITATFDVEALSIKRLGLRDASDREIFDAARTADAVVITKDADFPRLLESRGAPPRVIWITSGNTSNAFLRHLLEKALPEALRMIENGETLVEITSRSTHRESRS